MLKWNNNYQKDLVMLSLKGGLFGGMDS